MKAADEAHAVAAYLQGALAMTCTSGVGLKVARVEQWRDEGGDYLPFFDVVTESGVRVRVAVTPTL